VIGKREFEERNLLENYAAVMDELVRAKPAAAKGRYIRSVTFARRWVPASRSTIAHARHRRGDSGGVDSLHPTETKPETSGSATA